MNDRRLRLDGRVCLCTGGHTRRASGDGRPDAGGPSPSSRLRLTLGLLVVALALSLSADEISDSRNLQREAFAAYKAKDYATYLTKIAAASDLRPGHSTILYYRAAA